MMIKLLSLSQGFCFGKSNLVRMVSNQSLATTSIPEIIIRSATLQDEKAVTSLWHECNLTTSYNDPSKDFRFALNKPNSEILVAIQHSQSDRSSEETVCGSVMCGHDGHRGWLYYVACSPVLQKRGIGKMLIKEGEEWLRKCEIEKVQLLIRQSNEDVMKFYQHLGYDHTPRIVMAKWL